MKTCVVAIVGLDYADNFKHLPLTFVRQLPEGDVRFLIHTQPQREQRDGRMVGNYDLLLDFNYVTEFHDADYVSKRLDKYTQTMRLSEIAESVAAKRFQPVPMLNKIPNPTNIHSMTDLPDRVLIKSVDGARGVGHIIFDTTRGSLFKFLNRLYAAETSTVKDVFEEFKDCIEIHGGQKHHDNEIAETLKGQALMINRIVDNVKSEIRIVLDHRSKPTLIKVRERKFNVEEGFDKGTGYRQATGANRDNASRAETLGDVIKDPVILDEVLRVLERLPQLNSVDLFLTNNDRWGIFEYCNQFGTEAFDVGESMELHADFIANLYTRKMKPN